MRFSEGLESAEFDGEEIRGTALVETRGGGESGVGDDGCLPGEEGTGVPEKESTGEDCA